MSITGPGSVTAANVAAQTNMFKELNKLSLQLGTGEASQTYAGLGAQAGVALSLGSQLAALDGYSTTATTVGTTLTLAQSVLTQLDNAGSAVRQSANKQTTFTLDNNGQTSTQQSAASYLDQILSLLNTQAGDNYIFSGEAVNTPSVASSSTILNGNGGQAGFTQVMAERLQADQGASGLGRLVIPPAAGSTVSLSEDVAGSPFGFKLASLSSSLTGATITGPSGSPAAISIALGSNPNAGDSISFNLTLPDGSSQAISLQATTASPPGANQFTIGATAAATAANLQTALSGAVSTLAQTALPAASALAAANNFFSSDPPQRVNGPPFNTATLLVNGTAANTVFWYTGENSATPALQTATAQVGPNISVAYGLRANEQAISTLVGNVAALAAATYSASNPNAQASYQALCQKVTANLDGQPGTQKVTDIEASLANVQTAIANAGTLNTQTKTTLQNMLQGIEGVDQNQIGEQILTLQNNLSASLSVTARLAQISLVNYLSAPTGG
jgi:flagellin-like hook-associated protein FlgL